MSKLNLYNALKGDIFYNKNRKISNYAIIELIESPNCKKLKTILLNQQHTKNKEELILLQCYNFIKSTALILSLNENVVYNILIQKYVPNFSKTKYFMSMLDYIIDHEDPSILKIKYERTFIGAFNSYSKPDATIHSVSLGNWELYDYYDHSWSMFAIKKGLDYKNLKFKYCNTFVYNYYGFIAEKEWNEVIEELKNEYETDFKNDFDTVEEYINSEEFDGTNINGNQAHITFGRSVGNSIDVFVALNEMNEVISFFLFDESLFMCLDT